MERNSFKEYSVLAMVSKEEQRLIKAYYNFFYLDCVIAWLDEVAKVAHNAIAEYPGPAITSVGVLWRTRYITIDPILIQWDANKWRGILQFSQNRQRILKQRENKACFRIISPLKASKRSQITFCILSNVLSCISERFCLNIEQINIPPRPVPSSFLDRIFN